MSLILIVIYLIVLAILGIAGLVLVNAVRSKGSIARALNMSLFLITLPRETPQNSGQQKSEKDLVSVMEQLFSSFTNLHSKGWNKFLDQMLKIIPSLWRNRANREMVFKIHKNMQ